MKCNSNSSFEDLKKKLSEAKLPEVDFSKINSAIEEANTKLQGALDDLNKGLAGLNEKANLSLQEMLNDLKTSTSTPEFQAKVAEIKKNFGEAVDKLDEMIDKVSGGLSEALDKLSTGNNNLDSDISSAYGKLTEALSGGFDKLFANAADACEIAPNVEAKPDGTVVEKPPAPVTPSKPPEESVKKEPVTLKTVIALPQRGLQCLEKTRTRILERYNDALKKIKEADASTFDEAAFKKADAAYTKALDVLDEAQQELEQLQYDQRYYIKNNGYGPEAEAYIPKIEAAKEKVAAANVALDPVAKAFVEAKQGGKTDTKAIQKKKLDAGIARQKITRSAYVHKISSVTGETWQRLAPGKFLEYEEGAELKEAIDSYHARYPDERKIDDEYLLSMYTIHKTYYESNASQYGCADVTFEEALIEEKDWWKKASLPTETSTLWKK